MKKLFTMLVASLCGTMVYAQTGAVSVNDVTIVKGSTTQMEVTINNAKNNTAFQFDLALPAGVSVKEAKLNGEYADSRKMLDGPVTVDGKSKHRFLSYDDNNALLADGAKVIVTLAATEEAETAALTGDGFVVVTPEGTSVGDGETASADITVATAVPITFKAAGVTTFVSEKDLDFSQLENVKAFIVTGYDAKTADIWLARVMDAPAGTPLWVKGPKNETVNVPSVPSQTYYPTTLMIGSATAASTVPSDAGYANLTLSPSDGSTNPRDAGYELPEGKAFLHLPTDVTSTVGTSQEITLGAKGGLAYVAPCDLEFTDVDGLRAYTVMGYAKDGTMWIVRTQKASVGTPLYLKGGENGKYTVPSSEVKMTSVNMLKGGATSLAKVEGDNYNFVYIKGDGQWMPATKDYATWNAGTSYMPVPNTHYTPKATARGLISTDVNMVEAEVICINLRSLAGEDDNTTGIQRVDAQKFGDGEWYNLNGQRIDTPVKKGLYIHNGRKVVVK